MLVDGVVVVVAVASGLDGVEFLGVGVILFDFDIVDGAVEAVAFDLDFDLDFDRVEVLEVGVLLLCFEIDFVGVGLFVLVVAFAFVVLR